MLFPRLRAARLVTALLVSGLFPLLFLSAAAATFNLTAITPGGRLDWTNAFTNGVCNVQTTPVPGGQWLSLQSSYTTNLGGDKRRVLEGNLGFSVKW